MLKITRIVTQISLVIFLLFNNLFAIQTEEKPGSQPIKSQEMTQYQAYMSIPWLKNKVEKRYHIKKFQKLVDKMDQNARAKMETHYDFYHAQAPGFRVFQDFYKKCFEFFMIAAQLKHFAFLRMRDPIFDKYSDISDFLKDEFRKRGLIDDNLKETKCYVLSVNLSPFGNIGTPGEATFDYFLQGFSHVDPEPFLVQVFDKFGLDKRFMPELKKLDDMIFTKEGSLFQIFIPKKNVDKVAYLSWRHGVPFDEKIINSLFGGIFAPNDLVSEQIKKINALHTTPESKSFAAEIEIDKLFKNINDGTYRVSTLLEKYRTTPEKIKYLNNLQARLLLSNDMLLNPQSGVQIFRYTTVPKKTMDEYQRKLSKITNIIIFEWIKKVLEEKTIAVSLAEKSRLETLLDLMKRGESIEKINPQTVLNHVKMLQELKSKVKEIPPAVEPTFGKGNLPATKPTIEQNKISAEKELMIAKTLRSAEKYFENKKPASAQTAFNRAITLLKNNKIPVDKSLEKVSKENIEELRKLLK